MYQMADDTTKKGADHLGVEYCPTAPWILLSNYIYPKLHRIIVLMNDCIVYFEYKDKVECEILLVSNVDKQWRVRLIVLKTLVPQKEKTVGDWQRNIW